MKKFAGKTLGGNLSHERLVSVVWSINTDTEEETILKGLAFGQEIKGGEIWYAVSIPKDELEAHDMGGHGPCIIKQFPASKVTFLNGDGAKEEEDTVELHVLARPGSGEKDKVVKTKEKKRKLKEEKQLHKKETKREIRKKVIRRKRK